MPGNKKTEVTDDIHNQLLARPELPPLEPGTKVYSPELRDRIKTLSEHKYIVAALHLLNDDIHHAHLIAQDNEGDATADLLHATLHRREGDYWNSKYWWSNVRSHPTMTSAADAKAFVDACEAIKGSSKGKGRRAASGDAEQDEEMQLKRQQWEELKRLVEWTRETYAS